MSLNSIGSSPKARHLERRIGREQNCKTGCLCESRHELKKLLCWVGLIAIGLNYILFPPYVQVAVEDMKRIRSDTGRIDASYMFLCECSVCIGFTMTKAFHRSPFHR